jgi:F0F1-type ATP synthase membrane subunit c/vacuolar-type H+-ATPase subunit K
MKPIVQLTLLLAFLAALGCGGGESKVADKPTEEAIRQNEAANKTVDEEERQKPVKKAR